jgi:hypothetical protein
MHLIARVLCRFGRHSWVIDTWIPVAGYRAKAIVRYRCRRCGAFRNVWQPWPSASGTR